MKQAFLLLVAFALLPTVHAEQPLNGIAAVVNNDVVTLAEVKAITAEAEAKAGREMSGDALRQEVAKIRLKAINTLIDQKRAGKNSEKAK